MKTGTERKVLEDVPLRCLLYKEGKEENKKAITGPAINSTGPSTAANRGLQPSRRLLKNLLLL